MKEKFCYINSPAKGLCEEICAWQGLCAVISDLQERVEKLENQKDA